MVNISAVKFDIGYAKNMSSLVTPKSPKVKLKTYIGLGALKCNDSPFQAR